MNAKKNGTTKTKQNVEERPKMTADDFDTLVDNIMLEDEKLSEKRHVGYSNTITNAKNIKRKEKKTYFSEPGPKRHSKYLVIVRPDKDVVKSVATIMERKGCSFDYHYVKITDIYNVIDYEMICAQNSPSMSGVYGVLLTLPRKTYLYIYDKMCSFSCENNPCSMINLNLTLK